MGMDVYGEQPKGKRGEHFRNSCWYWPPLWDFVHDQCGNIITERDHQAGHYNNGYLIEAEKAEKVAARLMALCASGMVLDVEREHRRLQDAMPDEICDLCGGTGKRTDMIVQNGCNKCEGKGSVRPYATYYPFEAENVLEFAEFCEQSGGFRIS